MVATIETENGWTVTGTVTGETDAQVMLRVKSAFHGGIDCTEVVRPNMVLHRDNVKRRTNS